MDVGYTDSTIGGASCTCPIACVCRCFCVFNSRLRAAAADNDQDDPNVPLMIHVLPTFASEKAGAESTGYEIVGARDRRGQACIRDAVDTPGQACGLTFTLVH